MEAVDNETHTVTVNTYISLYDKDLGHEIHKVSDAHPLRAYGSIHIHSPPDSVCS